jgi:hypothetical protein
MDFALERLVFCHDLINPPAQSRSSYAWLDLLKSEGSFDITKLDDDSSESRYLLRIQSGHNLGFTTCEQGELENEFMNLVLAVNLTQNRICMTFRKNEFPLYKVTLKPSEPKVNVTKLNGGHHIHSEENLVFREESHASVFVLGQIEEKLVSQIFKKIQRLKRFEKKQEHDLQYINLNSALSHYESGILDFNPWMKFKHIFNSLELVVNMSGGPGLTYSDFDISVARISSATRIQAQEWREFYNRLKHVQKNSRDVQMYYQGTETFSDKLRYIRPTVNEILLSNL